MSNDRVGLRFQETVSEQFKFLENEYLFRITESNETFVRYETQDVFVNVFHGRISYEVGLEIGSLKMGMKTGYGLGSLVGIYDPEDGVEYRQYVAKDIKGVEKKVRNLARLLRKHGAKALIGDPDVFDLLEKDVQRYWSEMNAMQVRPQAEKAFREKNYAAVIKLYSSMDNILTKAERAKLNFARKKTALESE